MRNASSSRLLLAGTCALAAGLLYLAAGTQLSTAQAAEGSYGSVTGQFVFDGEIPQLKPLIKKGDAGAKDAAVCAADEVPNEELVVDPSSKGIAHMFVYLRKAPKDIHPDLKKSAEESVTFDQKGCRFIPHALLARTDQTVRVLSDDPILHNTHTYPLKNKSENTAIKANDRDGVAMKHPVPETLPLQVKCDIHPWMKAYWLILDHPYAAVTDEQGKFKIENLPVGTHEFVVWQELPGYVERKLKVTIEAGKQTDLGTIKVPATKFKG